MICIFRFLCVTVYIQKFSFRAESAFINTVQFSSVKKRYLQVFEVTEFSPAPLSPKKCSHLI